MSAESTGTRPTPASGDIGAGSASPEPPASYRGLAERAFADLPREPGVAKPDAILVADHVRRQFGGLTAVDVGHLEVQRHSITALIGPNGAGKTTLFNLLTGFDRPNSGSWQFNGQRLSGLPAHRMARRGMVRTFQLTKALSRLTVIENMRLGAQDQRGERFFASLVRPLWAPQEQAITDRADELLARFKLDGKREDFAGSLSGGQRKLLEMARALMSSPEMVMLDEPMAGVNPALTQSLLGHVKDLREQGMTVLFVEHDMDMVRDISDWVVVMAQGRIVAEGPPDSVMANPAVIDAYLGGYHDEPLADGTATPAGPSTGTSTGDTSSPGETAGGETTGGETTGDTTTGSDEPASSPGTDRQAGATRGTEGPA